MTKLDKAVEIIRGMTDEELKEFVGIYCPLNLGIHEGNCAELTCDECWKEEV